MPGVTPTCSDPRALADVPARPDGVAADDAAVGAADVVAAPVARRPGITVEDFAAFAVVIRWPLSNDVVLWHCEQSAVVGG